MAKKKNDEMGVEKSAPKIDFADILIEDINKKFKSGISVASYLHDPNAATHVKNWISTGCDILDLAISNRPNGGVPEGKVIEIMGLEASGKSLLAAHILANTQKQGGLAVLIDTESAATEDFFQAIGMDTEKLLYIQLDTIEDIFSTIEVIIDRARKAGKDKPITIVVDSIMGASTKAEMEVDYEKQGYATGKSIILSMAMRKITNLIAKERITLICTNQLRQKLNAMAFADPYTTSGGKAIAFHASVRIRLKPAGQIKGTMENGVTGVLGISTRAQVVKNRLGPPLRTVDYDIYFNSGIDNYGSWLTMLKQFKAVRQAGAWYTYEMVDPETGEMLQEVKFQSKDFGRILQENPELKNHIYESICDAYILDYKANADFGIDDVAIDTDFVGEES